MLRRSLVVAATLSCITFVHVRSAHPSGSQRGLGSRFPIRFCLCVKGVLIWDCLGHLLGAGTGNAGL